MRETIEFPGGFVRESEDGRATFDHLSLDDWEAIGEGRISDSEKGGRDSRRVTVTEYLLFVQGAAVDPHIDRKFLADMELLMYDGARKYSRDNWRKGCPRWRSFNAIIRHAVRAFTEKDSRQRRKHAAAVAINAMFLWGGTK